LPNKREIGEVTKSKFLKIFLKGCLSGGPVKAGDIHTKALAPF